MPHDSKLHLDLNAQKAASRDLQLRLEHSRLSSYDYIVEQEKARSALANAGNTTVFTSSLDIACRDNPMLASIKRQCPCNLMSVEERVAVAAIFVRHACARSAVGRVNWSSARARGIYVLRNRSWYCALLKFGLLTLIVITCFEKPSTYEGGAPNAHWQVCLAVEIGCALIFLVDLCLQVTCWTPKIFVTDLHCICYATCILSIVGDSLSALIRTMVSQSNGDTQYPFRWSRFFRPALVPYLSKTAQHMIFSIALTIPSLADLALCMLAVVLFYGLLGVSLFALSAEDRAALSFPSSPSPPSLPFANINVTTLAQSMEMDDNLLSTLNKTIRQMFILLISGDNYPIILWQTFDCLGVACNAGAGGAFMISFMTLGNVILMSVFVAVVFDVYKRQHAYAVLYEKVEQRKSLLAAFALLDTSDDGQLDAMEFNRLLHAVRPQISDRTRDLMFSLLDADGSKNIDTKEFLEASEVLILRTPERRNHWPLLEWSCPPLRIVATSKAWEALSALAIVAYIVLLVLQASDVSWTTESIKNLEYVDLGFVIVFTVEIIVNILGLSFETFWADAWNRLDLVVVVLSYASMALEATLNSIGSGVASLRTLRLLRLLRLLRMVRAFGKISGASMKTRVLMATLAQFGRIVVPMVVVLMCCSYLYGIIAMEFLSTALSRLESKSFATAECAPYCPSFENPSVTVFTLFQLLMGANWSPLLTEASDSLGQTFGPTLYFLSYITLCNVFFMSLLAALVLEVYAVEMDKAANSSGEDKMTMLCNAGTEIRDPGSRRATVMQLAQSSTNQSGTSLSSLTTAIQAKFRLYDLDNSGSLAAPELRLLLHDLGWAGVTDSEFASAMSALDSDGSGLVDYDEFLPWSVPLFLPRPAKLGPADLIAQRYHVVFRPLRWRRQGVTKVFAKYDADASGSVDTGELEAVMKELGLVLSPEEVSKALGQLDSSGDGSVSLDEYLQWFECFDMHQKFNEYDTDNSGKINKREFLQLACSLGLQLTKKERDKVFASLDEDGSGLVTFEEFFPWFSSVRSNTKQFVLGAKNWEDELFLSKHDSADTDAQRLIQENVAQIAAEIDAGNVPSGAELMRRICPAAVPLTRARSTVDGEQLKCQPSSAIDGGVASTDGIETIKLA